MTDREISQGPNADTLLDDLPVWPKVIGILSILAAVVGVFFGACAFAAPMFVRSLMKGQPGFDELPPTLTFGPLHLFHIGISIAWAFVLLAAGIATTLRRPAGRPLHLIYAVVALLLVLVGSWFQMRMQNDMQQWIQAHPENPIAKNAGTPAGEMSGKVGPLCGLGIGAAWPVFTLVWFGAVKRRNSDISAGVTEVL